MKCPETDTVKFYIPLSQPKTYVMNFEKRKQQQKKKQQKNNKKKKKKKKKKNVEDYMTKARIFPSSKAQTRNFMLTFSI